MTISEHGRALRDVRSVLVQRRRVAAARFVKDVAGMPALAVQPLLDIQTQIHALDAAIADEDHLARTNGNGGADVPTPHV